MDNNGIIDFIYTSCYHIMNLFYQEKCVEPIETEVEFVEDLFQRRLELAYDTKDMQKVIKSKNFISDSVGSMVLPSINSMKPHILIKKDSVCDDCIFYGTLIHELTHIFDYIDFAKLNNIESYRDVENNTYFNALYNWSEFHAKREGYNYYRKAIKLYGKDFTSDEIFNQIIYKELPYHLDNLRSNTEDNLFIYNIMHFLGRFSIWNDLFPSDFNIITLPTIEGCESQIKNLYEFLYINKTFDDIKRNFDELDILLYKFSFPYPI